MEEQLNQHRHPLFPGNIADVVMDSSADKRRNKLGYHRTSVACVHCRRRKIRCLVSDRNPQGRCDNCIRLKKECQFYGVEQQQSLDKKGRTPSTSDLSSADAATMATTPSAMGHPTVIDQKDSYFPYGSVPVNPSPAVSPYGQAPVAGAAISSYPSDPMMAHDLGSMQPLNQPVSWEDPSIYNRMPNSVTVGGTMNSPAGQPGWNQGQTSGVPISSASPISSTPNSSISMGSRPPPLQGAAGFVPAQEGQLWNAQAPGSVSMGNPADAGSVQYPSQLAPNPDFKPPISPPADVYSAGSLTSPTQGLPQPPIPYNNQSPSMVYGQWNAVPAGGGMPPNQSQPPPGWYPPDPQQLQYHQMKQGGMMLAGQGQMVDPTMAQQMRKPG